MQNKIIFSALLNQNEYIRSLAKLGISSFNVRVFNLVGFCDEINARLARVKKNDYKNDEEAAFYLLNAFKDDKRFKSYEDIRHVVHSIKEARSLSINDEELINKLKLNQQEPGVKIVLDVLLNHRYRDLMSYASETLASIKEPLFETVTIFADEYISSLAMALISKASKNVIKEKLEHHYEVKDISPCYGEENEIDAVLSQIKSNIETYKLDENLIVLMDENRYLYHLYRFMVHYKLPISFGNGVPINITNPYKLYRVLDDLEFVYQFDVDGYRALFKAESFKYNDKDNVYLPEILGYLKINFDAKSNKEKLHKLINNAYIEFLLKDILNIKKIPIDEVIKKLTDFVDEMSLGLHAFIKRHAYVAHNDNISETALQLIADTLIKADAIKNDDMRLSYLSSINKLTVGVTNSRPGYIHVVPFNKAHGIQRKNTYVLGLSSDIFPGDSKENYLLPDAVLKTINDKALTSNKKMRLQLDNFDVLLGELNKYHSNIYLSYSFFNLIDVKEANPTSKIYDLLAQQNSFANKNLTYLKEKKNDATYFSGTFNAINKLGQAFLKNNDAILCHNFTAPDTYQTSLYQDGVSSFSPSNIENYHKCPKMFFVQHLLDVNTDSDYDAYRVIPANHFGTLIHYLFEKYHHLPTLSAFQKVTNDLFDAYLSLNITTTPTAIDRYEFINAATIGYKYLKQFNTIQVEDWINFDNGIVAIRGRYDALAKTNVATSFLLIDYKTGRNVDRKSDDANTLLQIMLYIYMLKSKGYDVNSGVYLYVRSGHQVRVDYDETFVLTTLKKLRAALDKRDFVATPSNKVCDNCPIKDFCLENSRK